MLQSSDEDYDAQLYVISESKQPDFEEDRIIQWLDSIDIK